MTIGSTTTPETPKTDKKKHQCTHRDSYLVRFEDIVHRDNYDEITGEYDSWTETVEIWECPGCGAVWHIEA